jgi:hypothetical protein
MRIASLLAVAMLAVPAAALAQEADPQTDATDTAGEADVPAEAETETPVASPPRVPPVVVLPISIGRVPEETAVAVGEAVAEQLRPSVRRRDVVVIADEETLAAAAACADAPCIGAIIAGAGGISGVLVRMERARPRDPVTVMIGVVDPVSGAARGEPVRGEIPEEQVETPVETVQPLAEELAPLMPPAPRRTTLLVAANVDGATVSVDDQEVGTTPLAPGNIVPGEHTISVARPGYLVQSHRIEITAGQAARVNFDLEPTPETAAGDGADLTAGFGGGDPQSSGGGGSVLSQWWFWAAVGGGAIVVGVLIGVVAAIASSGPGQQEAISVPPIMQ